MRHFYPFTFFLLLIILTYASTGFLTAQEPGHEIVADFGQLAGSYCQGEVFSLPYRVNKNFNVNNIFIVQIDNTSNFSNPVTIATQPDTISGEIQCSIPPNVVIKPSTRYIIRIISTNPSGVFSNISPPLRFMSRPKTEISGPVLPCRSSTYMYCCYNKTNPDSVERIYRKWTVPNGRIVGPDNRDSVYVDWQVVGTASLRFDMEYNNACKDFISKEVIVADSIDASIQVIGDTGNCIGVARLEAIPNMKGVHYRWSTGSQSQWINVDTTGWYSVVISSNGCNSDTARVFVRFRHELKVKIISTVDGLCKGASATLEAKPDTRHYKFFKYLWSNGDTASKIIVHSPGTYFVFVENEIGCRLKFYIRIDSFPDLKAGIDVTGGNTICEGDTAALEALPLGSEYTYLWSTGESTRKIKVTKPGLYSVYVRSDYGCRDTASARIFVSPGFKARLSVSVSRFFCRGDSARLSASPALPGYKCLWSTGDTTFNITVKETGSYSARLTSEYGCSRTDSVNIIVHPVPRGEISAGGPLTFCDGDSVTLSADSADAGCSFYWSTGETSRAIVVKSSGTYILTTESSQLCRALDTVTVTVAPEINASIKSSAGKFSFCRGGILTLTAVPDAGGYTYLWSTGQTSSSIEVSEPGIYSVTVSLGDRCKGFSQAEVFVYPEPKVNIEGDVSFCSGNQVVLRTDKPFDFYHWSTGDTAREIIIDKPGTFSVEVTDSNGCSASASIEVNESKVLVTPPADVDFGKICSGEESIAEIILANQGDDQVHVKDTRIQNNNSVFSVLDYDHNVKPRENLKIPVSFRPQVIGLYSDSIIIEIDLPCKAVFSSEIKAVSIAKTLVWMPDTSTVIGSVILLPLYTKLMCGNTIPDSADFEASIHFDATALMPENTQQDGVTYSGIADNNRIMAVSGLEYLDRSTAAALKYINVKALLSLSGSTPLEISGFKWDNDLIEVQTKDGSLGIREICLQPLSRIKLMNAQFLSITPNPARDQAVIIVTGGAKGPVEINIYTLEGIIIDRLNIEHNGTESISNLGLDDYAAGVYHLSLTAGGEITVYRLVVLK